MATKIEKAKKAIIQSMDEFCAGRSPVLTRREIFDIFHSNVTAWNLKVDQTPNGFLKFLKTECFLSEFTFKCDSITRKQIRFVWRSATTLQRVASLMPNGFLTHGTALFVHNLTDQIPKRFYVNVEQSKKPSTSGSMSQGAIDRAFSKPHRLTKALYRASDDGLEVTMLNGKWTGNLEVSLHQMPDGSMLPVTSIERTLIDILVRPIYAGGIEQVIGAYDAAKEHASSNTLVATLRKFEYSYPFHQAIGFLMERTGWDAKQFERFRKMPRDFDFYLTYGDVKQEYDEKWRLFYPRGLF